MTIFFTSDTHWGHTNIIKFCKRPYDNVDDMNVDLVKKWNSVVKPEDTVWHLGDFSFKDGENFFHQLNGTKHLIIGNHDNGKVLALPWASKEIYSELEISLASDKSGQKHRFILFHYPIEEWDGFYKDAIHLHGHVHGKKMYPIKRRIDVAVDCFGYMPVAVEKLVEMVAPQTNKNK